MSPAYSNSNEPEVDVLLADCPKCDELGYPVAPQVLPEATEQRERQVSRTQEPIAGERVVQAVAVGVVLGLVLSFAAWIACL